MQDPQFQNVLSSASAASGSSTNSASIKIQMPSSSSGKAPDGVLPQEQSTKSIQSVRSDNRASDSTPPSDDAARAMAAVSNWEGGSGWKSYKLNPVVTISSVIIIWSFIIVAITKPDYMLKALDEAAFKWIQEVWVWFYIVSQNIWIIVLVWILIIPRYGDLKLGLPDDPPAYSFSTWFSLLFSAGVAVGIFYYAVAEPLWHYKGAGNARWVSSVKGYGNTNEDAIHAIMVTWFHWGLHGWIPYTTMGGVLAIMSHRRGFPMSIRYCFYPLIGTRTHGLWGDCIDTFSIVTTIFGVCSSLGIGAMQLNDGFQRLSHGFYQGTLAGIPANTTSYSNPTCGGQGQRCEPGQIPYGVQTNTETQLLIIACITCCATASVVSGMNAGIVNLSRICFALGMFILLSVLFLGETYHSLDVFTQALGYYMWYLPKIAFQTDAYESLGSAHLGQGGASDDGGGAGWMAGWTLFYWGWWISWGPFVGTFIAKISKGRTMRQFIIGTLIVPSVYSFFWFGIWGAEGIRMQRIADSSGLCKVAARQDISLCRQEGTMRSRKCYLYAASYTREMKEKLEIGFNPNCQLDPVYHNGFGRCKEFKWERRVAVGNKCVKTTTWVHAPCNKHGILYGGPDNDPSTPDPTALAYPPVRGPCKGVIMMSEVDPHSPKRNFNWFYGAQPKCFVPVPDNTVCLYGLSSPGTIFFDQLSSYGPQGFSDLLCTVATIALVLYFVTSSDSGSYVVDMLASNGDEDPPLSQRIFWSITEGTTACALLYAGKNMPDSKGALKALQGASLLTGLPYTFILFWTCQALVLLVKEEAGDVSKERKRFKRFIFDLSQPTRIVINSLTPGVTMGKIIETVGGWPFSSYSPKMAGVIFTIIFQGLYLCSIALVCILGSLEQWHIVGLVCYTGFATFLCFLRNNVRLHVDIPRGDLITDFICAVTVPMFTLHQLEYELWSSKVDPTEGQEKLGEEAELLTTYGLPRE